MSIKVRGAVLILPLILLCGILSVLTMVWIKNIEYEEIAFHNLDGFKLHSAKAFQGEENDLSGGIGQLITHCLAAGFCMPMIRKIPPKFLFHPQNDAAVDKKGLSLLKAVWEQCYE